MSFPKPKIFAHYLPQFHRIPENSKWWGPGFTEWTNVATSKPLFPGHDQPRVPRELGFYDLSNLDVMREQVELAKRFGVDGFNFYFYWFSGRRILEGPLERFLNSDIDFNFSITWANENWSRRWDGSDNEVLIEQIYEKDFEERLLGDLFPYLQDSRYLHVSGVPFLSIYRAQELPNPESSIAKLKSLSERSSLGGLHLSAVQSFNLESPAEVGADSLMEFPPHGAGAQVVVAEPRGIVRGFSGQIMDYRTLVLYSINRPTPPFKFFRGLLPSWDNTPRVGNRAHLFLNSSPELFKTWIAYLYADAVDNNNEALFVNAWNEWAEGAYLEPDLRHGLLYLENLRLGKELGSRGLLDLPESVQKDLGDLAPQPHRSLSPAAILIRPTIFRSGSIRALLTRRNFLDLLGLFQKHRSPIKVLTLVLRHLNLTLRPARIRAPRALISEIETQSSELVGSVAFVIHIYYPEFVKMALKVMSSAPFGTTFFISTSSVKIAEQIKQSNTPNTDVRLVPNRGRNFGPLLVEFAAVLKNFDIVFHLHSKKSAHSKTPLGTKWNDLLWESLAGSTETIERIIRLMNHNSKIGVVYPDVTKIVKRTSFSWHLNSNQGKRLLKEWGFGIPPDPIAFPAGGMAVFRPSSLQQLLERQWNYEDFPEEMGQIDGTTHHMVERLLGVLPILNGYQHGVYSPETNNFSSNLSYLPQSLN